MFLWLILFTTFASSTCFGPQRSFLRSVFYKLYVQIWYVVICVLFDTSSRNGWTYRVVRYNGWTYRVVRYNGWTYRVVRYNVWTYLVVRVLPHTKSAHTACKRHSWGLTCEIRNMSSQQVLWIKINHKLYIVFDYIYIARWYTVPTISCSCMI
jgi:hypothetical protein